MSNIPEKPTCPEDWQKYAASTKLDQIPFKEDYSDAEATIGVCRDVYIDGPTFFKTIGAQTYLYTDVFALAEETALDLGSNGSVSIIARVLTADAPAILKISLPPAGGFCVLDIWASQLDQPVKVCVGDSEPKTLNLGPGSGHLGVDIAISGPTDGSPNGSITLNYYAKYSLDKTTAYQDMLETQLRIASVLFWSNTYIATAICSHVATFTMMNAPQHLMNAQAVALGQQLAAQVMTADGSNYVPVLQLGRYMDTLDAALDVSADFEAQYNRFEDKDQAVKDQLVEWQAMLEKARDEESTRSFQREAALAKYTDADKIAKKCSLQMQADSDAVELAGYTFDEKVREWIDWNKFLAVCKILIAIAGFAASVGGLFFGGAGNPAAEADAAIKTVEEEADAAKEITKVISSDTLSNLKKCIKALQSMYPKIQAIVDAAKKLQTDVDAEIPPSDDIPGTGSSSDPDAAVLVALASWDAWTLEADMSVKFAVDNKIETADTYQLALRKHAITGKLYAQSQAEAVKAGHQYVQAAMEVVICQRDVKRLESLITDYTGQELVYKQAKAGLFDRFMAIRTSVIIEMRNIVWAYKYYALKDSQVVLDILKSTADYKQDRLLIKQDIDAVDSAYSQDDQEFDYYTPSYKLPGEYHRLLLEGLKTGPDHEASFTLSPELDANGERSSAAEFTGGFHYRLKGMEPTLRGVVPLPDKLEDGKVIVALQITTSGMLQDVQDDKVFSFSRLHQPNRFSYELDASGTPGRIRDHAIYDTSGHTEPTPFTQWTIKLLTPDVLDLSGLSAVDLYWAGHVRFPKTRRRLHK